MASITLEGLDELSQALNDMAKLDGVKRVVKQNGADLQRRAQRKAQFRGHWEGKRFVKPTGTLKRSISGPNIIDGGLTAEVAAEAEYAGYVEFGTRFMDAQPYMRPALQEQIGIFERDLTRLFK